MKRIATVGLGYVGLVTAAVFADLGNKVVAIDHGKEKVAKLKQGEIHFYEPGLKELVTACLSRGNLEFTTDIAYAVENSDIIFITVGTPSKEDGSPDLTAMHNVAEEIGKSMKEHKIIVEKSTVPVQTADWLKLVLRQHLGNIPYSIASVPEFLREGTAIHDFKYPDRVVIGADNDGVADKELTELYKPIVAPIFHVSIPSAEIIKHGSNAFLYMKISFINLIASLCEKTGANIDEVASAIGADKRIGKDFLRPGIVGGFCFPKDLDAFVAVFESKGIDASLLRAVKKINDNQIKLILEKINNSQNDNLKDKTIAVLGLSFKPNTDDMRFAPAIPIIEALQKKGAKIKAYDPKAMENAKKVLKDVQYTADPYETAENASLLLILTEWSEFENLDFTKLAKIMRSKHIVDARNMYRPEIPKRFGFTYSGFGRS